MPKYILIAGVNGAGKSTLYHSLPEIQNIQRINTDDIVRSFGDWRNASDIMKAGKMAVHKIQEYFENGISFNQETTLCGKSIIRNIHEAKKKGYTLEVHYIGVESVEIAKERVNQRMLNGGHGVSEEDIERRYRQSLLNMRYILPECDLTIFYDNSIEFRQLAIYRNGNVIIQSTLLPKWYRSLF